MLLRLVLVLSFGAVFAYAGPLKSAQSDEDWWKTAVVYQVYPRSFRDSDNDGVGDLRGVIEKLEDLVDAGVTALWLSPIYKSPQKDHGYDISDFRDVDPIFGTLEDFEELVAKAHGRGLKIVLDYVPNHSSDEHEWFIKSENNEEPYKDYYIWLEGRNDNKDPPNNWVSYFHGPAWKFSEKRQKWYLHQFHEGQPDLDFRNRKVVQEMKDVITFWLDKGVDGFRVDTIPSLVEVAGYPDEPLSGDPNSTPNDHGYLQHPYTNDQPETFDMVYQWRALLDDYNEKHGGAVRIMMTEAYSGIDTIFKYYGNETHNGAHFSFNFNFITRLSAQSSAQDIRDVIHLWMDNMPKHHTANWVLGNHDQHRVASRYGKKRADGMTMLAMLLPGVVMTYNGEEIGLEDGEVNWEQGQDPQACNGRPEDFDRYSRDFQRTPYQWNDGINAGFNDGHQPWLPVSSKYISCNLAAQNKPNVLSHYNVYKKLVQLRREDTIKTGHWEVKVFSKNVLALARSLDNEKSYVLVMNISDMDEIVDLTAMKNVAQKLSVEVNSVYSAFKLGALVDANKVHVGAYEAVIFTS